MSRFVDQYLPDCVAGYPVYSSPRFSTDIVVVDSGREQVNRRWIDPLHRYTLPEVVRTMEVFNAVRAHWFVMGGPARIFPFRDPFDFASVDLSSPTEVPIISTADQVLGIGDDLRVDFQIIKEYVAGVNTYVREIYLPVVSSVIVAIDGVQQMSGWSVDREGGMITFETPPITDAIVSCGYLFDVSVRFESDDSFDAICQTFGLGGYSDLTLLETRLC